MGFEKFIGYTVGYPDNKGDDQIGEEIFSTKKEAVKHLRTMEKIPKWERENSGLKNPIVLYVYAVEYEKDFVARSPI